MSRFSTRRIGRLVATIGIASAILLGTLVAPAATLAKGSDGVRATGTCTIRSTSKIKAKHDNGRIEVEFEVDQNRNNRLWTVRIYDDGIRVFTGLRRTVAPSGSFAVTRLDHQSGRHGHDRRPRRQRVDRRGLPRQGQLLAPSFQAGGGPRVRCPLPRAAGGSCPP